MAKNQYFVIKFNVPGGQSDLYCRIDRIKRFRQDSFSRCGKGTEQFSLIARPDG